MGGGRPIIDAQHICFHRYWDFVMTGELPYDAVVVAALTSFKVHAPEGRLSSDGGPDEWAAGIALFLEATGPAHPAYAALQTLPARGLPDDRKAYEASPEFSSLETVGHVSGEDPRLHRLLGELGVALREPGLTAEAIGWLRMLKCGAWERKLEAAVASGVATFAMGV